MELDELKSAWARVERQLEIRNRLELRALRDSRRHDARGSLRPLYLGQSAQIVIGIVLTMLAAPVWIGNLENPHLLVSGVIVHVYGLALVVCGAWVLVRLSRVAFDAPVVEVQRQLLAVEQAYVRGGWLVGLPWWILWIAFALFIPALFGIDLARVLPLGWIGGSLAFGVAGMVATLAFVAWARRSGKPGLAQKVNASLAGRSLGNARRHLADLEAFEADAC